MALAPGTSILPDDVMRRIFGVSKRSANPGIAGLSGLSPADSPGKARTLLPCCAGCSPPSPPGKPDGTETVWLSLEGGFFS